MRTTIQLDEDTRAAIEGLRRTRGVGLSEAVNELIRRGLLTEAASPAFRQRTRRLGLKIDVSNVADAIEALDGPTSR